MANNNIDENTALKKYELNRNVFCIVVILTLIVVITKLFCRKIGFFYYGLETIVFLTYFVFLFPILSKNKINLFSKNFDENIAIKDKIFETMWTVAFLVYVIGPILIIIYYPQKIFFAGLYSLILFIPASYYLHVMLKNKNLISEKEKEKVKIICASKINFVIIGLFYGLGMEFFFSFFFAKEFNIIEVILLGALFGTMMYGFLRKCSKK